MTEFVGPRKDKNITIETATEEEASFFDKFTNKFKNRVSEEMDKYSQERVDLSRLHHYSYPIDLNGSAQETGLPFIRFGIKPVTATERVAIYLYQPPGFSVSDGANYANFDVGSIRGGLNLLKSAASGQSPNITN